MLDCLIPAPELHQGHAVIDLCLNIFGIEFNGGWKYFAASSLFPVASMSEPMLFNAVVECGSMRVLFNFRHASSAWPCSMQDISDVFVDLWFSQISAVPLQLVGIV